MNIIRQKGNFQFEEDPFRKTVPCTGKIYQYVLLFLKFLQTRPQFRIMNIKYYDLYYNVIKNRDDKEIEDDKYEKIETEYKIYNDFITPNRYVGNKKDNVLLKERKLRSHINHFK